MKNLILVLVTTLALLTATMCVAQPLTHADFVYLEQLRGMSFPGMVSKNWLHTCEMNRASYPDSNMVLPGQVIQLPCNMQYVAKPTGGKDHMWQASLYFTNNMVVPYLQGKLPAAEPTPTLQPKAPIVDKPEMANDIHWWWALSWGVIIVTIVIIIAWASSKIIKTLQIKTPSDTPFLVAPPDLRASDAEVLPAAEQSLQTALGRGFQIIGAVERGTLNGEQTTFFRTGTHRTERYHNDPGFRARLRFTNGVERLVVCRWSCFNPCWGATTTSEFKGTFTPEGGVAQEIPVLTADQALTVKRNIQAKARGENVVAQSSTIPETPPPKVPKAEEQSTVPPAPKGEEGLRFTKLQFSLEKGINLEGNFALTIKELQDLIGQVKGKLWPEVRGEERKDK